MNAAYTLNDQQYAIICKGIYKVYDSKVVVDHIDLKIKQGSIFGLLGPNGAGKTTIIKMLTGLSMPTEGEALVANFSISKESIKVKENIGWVSSDVILDDSLNIMENIWIQAKLHNMGKEWKEKARALLEYMNLDMTSNKKVGQFSTGMRKKLEIIMALIHEPKILFLDEPTIGLDANTRRLFWKLIKKINKLYGVTIFLTTHYMEEADALCDDLAIINYGKIITSGSPKQLKSLIGNDILEIEFTTIFDFSIITNVKGVKTISEEIVENEEGEIGPIKHLKLLIKVDDAENALIDIISLVTKIHPHIIKSIKIEKPSLESIFLELTGISFMEAEKISTNAVSENKIKS